MNPDGTTTSGLTHLIQEKVNLSCRSIAERRQAPDSGFLERNA
jgi:hypothetical protein